jgi:CheY-like chemotaxis protein
VFVLDDGEVVVQWDAQYVQDLLTGHYRRCDSRSYGRPVADRDLEQLKRAGCVEHYDRQFVWLFAQPERERFEGLTTQEQMLSRRRSYYLNTMRPASDREALQAKLSSAGLKDTFTLREIEGGLAVFGQQGKPFVQLKDAEAGQRQLQQLDPELFGSTAVAFIEMPVDQKPADLENDASQLELDDLIASQDERDRFVGKCALLVCPEGDERGRAEGVLKELGFEVRTVTTAADALIELEGWHPHLVVMDLHLPDMHGWQMLSRAREILDLTNIRIIVLAEGGADEVDNALALTVARVSAVLIKPVGTKRLRRSVWLALKGGTP